MTVTQNTKISGSPTDAELELINKYTVKPLEAQDVYTFGVVLCDNEIDRDFERFDIPALKKLAELFVGKTGIFDHSLKGKDQTARIFSCEVVSDPQLKNSVGEPYTKLTARAYMPRTQKNAQLIEEIDAGIKKETSVGCAVSKSICSICGKDTRTESCPHMKGKTYAGKTCHRVLSEPKDAYEWSFVAVPAQPAAGVTKSYTDDVFKTVKRLSDNSADIMLSKNEAAEIYSYISSLRELAREGKEYRDELLCDVIRMGAVALPQMKGESLSEICRTLNLEQLKELKKAFSGNDRGLRSQLASKEQACPAQNNEFKI
ncbi:MAG: hypothetical protein IJF40_02315 [Clostridia bacterium]|nr:hypothetical protein [Clostridia bacterium]